jgi:AcrR family transcriptional regulator
VSRPLSASRRRGAELESALLGAAWEELVAVGYGGFTFEGVAERAHTSRPVVYRRWSNRAELAIAAIAYHARQDPVEPPDTGSLREDLIALLRTASDHRSDLAVMVSVQMGQFWAEAGTTPAEIRERFLAAREGPFWIDEVLARAVARGELDPARLTPRVASLPADLLRHELLMTLQPVPDETIREIVDDIFLPLVMR